MKHAKQYRLPPRFYEDHRARDCGLTGQVIRERKSYVLVSLDQESYDDLRSDCEYHIAMAGMGAYDAYYIGLIASARATLRRLDANPMAVTSEGHLGLNALLADDGAKYVPAVSRRFVFSNPGAGFPRTIETDAVSEAQARRRIAADLPQTRDWPLEEGR